ncbi:hypothetical protein [Haloechinothrix alba]|uniref:hypothetical protein n=1 Tax=Haloechinothrix alba TaxID=664784 RepID=UPI001595CB58|nr:hypothetical protein [Haloechinothrix alba]
MAGIALGVVVLTADGADQAPTGTSGNVAADIEVGAPMEVGEAVTVGKLTVTVTDVRPA